MTLKERAAEAAVAFVQSGMILGLGTGSTANCFLQSLANALNTGKLRNIRGVPTSRHSEEYARQLGIPLATLVECPNPDLTVDGCDEVDPHVDLIKGLGGALLREKIVAQNSKRLIIIADSTKRVPVLGSRHPLPVEVAVFGHEVHVAYFQKLGAVPVLRRTPDGKPFVTDNGNYIYDCRFKQIDRPVELEAELRARAGVVECGLFLHMAERVLIAGDSRVEEIRR
ncbi:MAG: ribose-5-phosphate isomerase RpiA [Bacillota bacterium]